MTDQKIQLLAVPNFLHSLTIKADLNGITVLKDGRYKKRYTGSRAWEVDINGTLRKKSELKTLMGKVPAWAQRSKIPKKKGPGVPSATTAPTDKPKSYTVNKPEIRARIFSMIAAQPVHKKELYFWTVTFPLKTDDATIYRLFNTWLTKLRQKRLLQNYLWVAERQENGTLHFHICIPHKMPAKVANREMMITLCTAARRGEINYNLHACKRYNGVDISKPRNKQGKVIGPVTNFATKRGRRALTNYVTKYITKNNGTFSNLAWHHSRGFSILFTGVTFTYAESRDVYKWRFFCHSRPAIQTEFFIYYPWINGPPPQIENELLKLNSYIQNLN